MPTTSPNTYLPLAHHNISLCPIYLTPDKASKPLSMQGCIRLLSQRLWKEFPLTATESHTKQVIKSVSQIPLLPHKLLLTPAVHRHCYHKHSISYSPHGQIPVQFQTNCCSHTSNGFKPLYVVTANNSALPYRIQPQHSSH